MPAYFARCLRGLEDFCAVELSAIAGLNLRERKIRTLFFEFSGPPQRLGEVRSLDDIFIHLGSHTGINHTRAMLSKIPELLPPMFKKLDEEIEIIQRYRELSTNPSFSLTIGLQGRKNFSRFELQNNLLPLFQKHLTGTYIPNEKGSKGAELDFRISLEGDQLDLGLRLGEKPFHRRTYKLQSRPGSTKAPLAYIMASLASIEADHLVLDPCCGVGTILIEASLAFPSARYLGIDIKEEALQSAEVNRKEAGCEIDFKLGDARRLRLMDASVDRIVSNPPWGRQVASHLELIGFYREMYLEWKRLLKAEAKLVVLTDQEEIMTSLLQGESAFLEVMTYELSLFGSVVKIYVWQREA